jgi:hypothetical protein
MKVISTAVFRSDQSKDGKPYWGTLERSPEAHLSRAQYASKPSLPYAEGIVTPSPVTPASIGTDLLLGDLGSFIGGYG